MAAKTQPFDAFVKTLDLTTGGEEVISEDAQGIDKITNGIIVTGGLISASVVACAVAAKNVAQSGIQRLKKCNFFSNSKNKDDSAEKNDGEFHVPTMGMG